MFTLFIYWSIYILYYILLVRTIPPIFFTGHSKTFSSSSTRKLIFFMYEKNRNKNWLTKRPTSSIAAPLGIPNFRRVGLFKSRPNHLLGYIQGGQEELLAHLMGLALTYERVGVGKFTSGQGHFAYPRFGSFYSGDEILSLLFYVLQFPKWGTERAPSVAAYFLGAVKVTGGARLSRSFLEKSSVHEYVAYVDVSFFSFYHCPFCNNESINKINMKTTTFSMILNFE